MGHEQKGNSEQIPAYEHELYRVMANPEPIRYLSEITEDRSRYNFARGRTAELLDDVNNDLTRKSALTELTWHVLPNIADAVEPYQDYGLDHTDLVANAVVSTQELFLRKAQEDFDGSLKAPLPDTLNAATRNFVAEQYGVNIEDVDKIGHYLRAREVHQERHFSDPGYENFDQLSSIYFEHHPPAGLDSPDESIRRKARMKKEQETIFLRHIHHTYHRFVEPESVVERVIVQPEMDTTLIYEEITEAIAQAGTHLTEPEKHVLDRRYGHKSKKQPTLEEIGQELGVTRTATRQIETTALRKLRHPSISSQLRELNSALNEPRFIETGQDTKVDELRFYPRNFSRPVVKLGKSQRDTTYRGPSGEITYTRQRPGLYRVIGRQKTVVDPSREDF